MEVLCAACIHLLSQGQSFRATSHVRIVCRKRFRWIQLDVASVAVYRSREGRKGSMGFLLGEVTVFASALM